MNGMITIGTLVISVETAWKAGVVGILTTIAIILLSIYHWLMT